ncbi:hypothetical protein H4F99_09020 [Lysobacter sp. SG-8]|uniref:Uncharacterized protein n=1 Tax=Marilutibacter penaei TaxID=2759900 RepID=A0A7W3U487_9GAMM|nr:hypothetical protein [Lysobacter penaei]MBB1088628.1 hypothetical protein [Lysobacter penaei]
MHPIVRNVLGVVLGLVVGSAVNMAIISFGPMLVPPPAGVDVMDPDSLAQGMHLFEPKHFLVPFLAHALGTLVGATIASAVAARRKGVMAAVVGVFFLAGGIAAATMIPAPAWFIALDLLLAYLPMAWLGHWIAGRFGPRRG